MAVTNICAELKSGQDSSCTTPLRRYYQQAVIINKSDIDTSTVVVSVPTTEDPECTYNVQFSLKEGKTGFRFTGANNGSVYKGYFDKTTSDQGYPQYKHNVQIFLTGTSEDAKCILDSLSKGNFIVALQFSDGTVEIYGWYYGLSTGDFTYDVQENGGGTAIILSSLDIAPESYVPFVYKSLTTGGENADFDANFENAAPSI